jgi:hypothetical protein
MNRNWMGLDAARGGRQEQLPLMTGDPNRCRRRTRLIIFGLPCGLPFVCQHLKAPRNLMEWLICCKKVAHMSADLQYASRWLLV